MLCYAFMKINFDMENKALPRKNITKQFVSCACEFNVNNLTFPVQVLKRTPTENKP